MSNNVEIITVDDANVDERGFFCYKSKPQAEGYQRKLAWLKARFAEGMVIKMVYEDGSWLNVSPTRGSSKSMAW